MSREVEQELLMEKLSIGDRPSILALGIFGAQSLKKAKVAVFMVDALGRVQIMAPDAVEVKQTPRVSDEDLDKLEEEDAINIMLQQGDDEKKVVAYLRGREERHG